MCVCAHETPLPWSTFVAYIQPHSLTPLFACLWIRLRGHPQASIEIALSMKAEHTVLDCIPVNSFCVQLDWTFLHMSTIIEWSTVGCSFYLCTRTLITSLQGPTTTSTETCLDYSEMCTQQTLWSPLVIVIPKLNTKRGGMSDASGANFPSQSIALTTVIASSRFVPSTDFGYRKGRTRLAPLCCTWVDRNANGHRWFESSEHYESFWPSTVDTFTLPPKQWVTVGHAFCIHNSTSHGNEWTRVNTKFWISFYTFYANKVNK